ncbi:MAG: glycosyltransferase [Hymenobacter sp.]|nr:MAG: glycosyltransferase [Hymenobacter sp.]
MKLSIITISYNNEADLEQTIKSVLEQTWSAFEYIIIDGGSTDKSAEIIEGYQSKLTYWVSEPDQGIYHAMNKGISRATGEYLLMLNAGDFLAETDVLERVFATNAHQEDLLVGDVHRTANGEIFQDSQYAAPLTFSFFRKTSISHQATFIKRSLHDTVGLYDEGLRFSSDWKFFVLAICKYDASYKNLPFFIATCDCGGLTWNPRNFPAIRKEMRKVQQHYFSAFVTDYDEYEYLQSRTIKRQLSGMWPAFKNIIKSKILKREVID